MFSTRPKEHDAQLVPRTGTFTAVDDVSFMAHPGRVTGFLGPNGAGKSTTMRIMVGLARPTGELLRAAHYAARS